MTIAFSFFLGRFITEVLLLAEQTTNLYIINIIINENIPYKLLKKTPSLHNTYNIILHDVQRWSQLRWIFNNK